MSRFKFLPILLISISFLTACGDAQIKQVQQQLQEAQEMGDLEGQIAAVSALQEHDQSNAADWQKKLKELEQAKSFNDQADQILKDNPFDALDLYGKSDQLAYNKHARTNIIDIIKPYKDFELLYKPMREWAYPKFEKMVVSGSLGDGFVRWTVAVNKPNLWPDSMLIALLTSKNHNPLDLAYGLTEERKSFNEIQVLTRRLAKDNPEDNKSQALDEDAAIINAMYNAVLTDWHWHQMKKALQTAIEFNDSMLLKAQSWTNKNNGDEYWYNQSQAKIPDISKTIKLCCIVRQRGVQDLYGFVERPSTYDSTVAAFSTQYLKMLEQNFTLPTKRLDYLAHATEHSKRLQQKIDEIDALAAQIDRDTIASDYLRTTYLWQNNAFFELERLVPYLKHYKTSLRGY